MWGFEGVDTEVQLGLPGRLRCDEIEYLVTTGVLEVIDCGTTMGGYVLAGRTVRRRTHLLPLVRPPAAS
jgi:hypothetical protein